MGEPFFDDETFEINLAATREILLEIRGDVKELKQSKLDSTIHAKDLTILELQIAAIRDSVSSIKNYARIFTTVIAGSIIVAVMDLILGKS